MLSVLHGCLNDLFDFAERSQSFRIDWQIWTGKMAKNRYIIIRHYRFCGIYCRSTRRCAQNISIPCKQIANLYWPKIKRKRSRSEHHFFSLVTFMHPKVPGETQKAKCLSKHWQSLDKRNLYAVYLMHRGVESCKVITIRSAMINDAIWKKACVCGENGLCSEKHWTSFSHRLAN